MVRWARKECRQGQDERTQAGEEWGQCQGDGGGEHFCGVAGFARLVYILSTAETRRIQVGVSEGGGLGGGGGGVRDSGTWRGRHRMAGGRAAVRAVLYMATVAATRASPVIRACYPRLRAAGKPSKVALTACMRKLLVVCTALCQHQSLWDPTMAVPNTVAHRFRPKTPKAFGGLGTNSASRLS